MKNVIVMTLLMVGLTGCSWFKCGVKTEIQTVETPILYCPAPKYQPLPETLPVDAIDDKTTDGEVVVRYKATVKLLKDHSKQLEMILDQYKTTNMTYEQLRQQILNEQKNTQ